MTRPGAQAGPRRTPLSLKDRGTMTQPTGEDRFGLQVSSSDLKIDDLVLSYDREWEMMKPTKSALGCRTTLGFGMDQRTGQLIDYFRRCRTYGHRPCAEEVVRTHLQRIAWNLGASRSGFGVVLDESEFVPHRLAERRYDRQERAGGEPFYRWTRRQDGSVWVISNVNLGGRKPPKTLPPIDDVLVFAAVGLFLPGVLCHRGSRIPAPPKNPSDFYSLGNIRERDYERFCVAVADEVERKHGFKIGPLFPIVAGGRLKPDQWIEAAEKEKLTFKASPDRFSS